MSGGRVHIEKVFDRQYLFRTSGGDDVFRVLSGPIQVVGNSARIDATVVNVTGMSGSDVVRFLLEGSHDLRTWQLDGLGDTGEILDIVNPSTPENAKSTNAIDIHYPYVRLKANLIASSGAKAIVNATVVFTQQ